MNIDTRKEAEAENNIENSASGQDMFDNILNTGNENAFKEILGDQDGQRPEDDGEDPSDLFGGFEKKISTAPEEKGAAEAENAGKTGAAINAPAVNEYGKKGPEADIYPGERPAKPEFYEDPGGPDLIEFLGREPNKKKKTDIPFDLVTNMPRTKRKGKNGRLEKQKKARKKDREKLEAEQKKVAGLNFSLHKLPERNKAGGFSRFLSNLAIAAGSTIGKSFNWVGALFARMFSSSFRRRYRNAHSSDWKNPLIRQNKRIHDVIPGWNGEKFQPGPDGKDDILADFRRIPTVWSALTAAQAEDSDGKPLAPKISIYVRKGGEDDKTLEGFDPGHAGIGIEYSRYSRRSNRYERYNLRYGFYPANRDNKKAGSLSMVSSAIIPGKLKDESGYVYTIKRTYSATAKQVNRILKASETYADKGYNLFRRNCTTFVREMIQNQAGITAGKDIFEQEAPGLSSLVNFGLFTIKASEFTTKTAFEGSMEKLAREDDLNYGGEGNKRLTRDQYRQYKASIRKSGGYIGKADLPNAAAENMRRLEGEDAGMIGSKEYTGTARKIPGNAGSSGSGGSSGGGSGTRLRMETANIRDAIHDEAVTLIQKILDLSGKNSMREFLNTPGLDENLKAIFVRIGRYSNALDHVTDDENDPHTLRQARSQLDQGVAELNTLLGIFHNDERLHLPVMHMISMLEWGIEVVDSRYGLSDIGKDASGDLADIRKKMGTNRTIFYRKPNTDPNSKARKVEVSVEMSPSHYESYLQIYKSPRKAIDTYKRFNELRGNNHRTDAENEEYKKLKRIDDLACQYDSAHNYMLEKDSYSQQDVDYAFSLGKLEDNEQVSGNMFISSASGIYKSLILEKIFGEFRQRFENNFNAEDAKSNQKVQAFLDADMTACIERKPNELKTVIRGMMKSMPGSTPEDIFTAFMNMLKKDWIDKLFDNKKFSDSKNKTEIPMFNARTPALNAFKKLSQQSQLKTKLETAIKQVFDTQEKAGAQAGGK